MARKSTGQIIERRGQGGVSFGLRFRDADRVRGYLTAEARTRAEAETELANYLADARRGLFRWSAVAAPVEKPAEIPTFHTFASEWLRARELEGLAEKTIADLRWSLTNHLLPHFADFRLSEIDPMAVDRYKVAKAQERQELDRARERGDEKVPRGLSNNSINHVLSDLAQVLETAVEYGLLAQNPASGKRRRLKSTRPSRPCVEPEQLPALLDAAKTETGELGVGRALLGLLAGAGLRIGEALALRWRYVDLATGTLYVAHAKTDAGVREVDLTPSLREELIAWRLKSRFSDPEDYVVTASGRKHNPSNLRRDVLRPAIEAANAELVKDGIAEISGITFHSLRRTFASLRCVCGDDVRYIASQIGHTDVRFTLSVYAQATKRRERLSGSHLKAYDRALEWARMDANTQEEVDAVTAEATGSPV